MVMMAPHCLPWLYSLHSLYCRYFVYSAACALPPVCGLPPQEQDVRYELGLKDHLVPMLHAVDCEPSYFIVGGRVFMPLTQVGAKAGKCGRRLWVPMKCMCFASDFDVPR